MKPPAIPNGLHCKARAFGRDCRGSFATITGVSIVAIMLCAGIALDYTRIAHTRSIINDALDAAILAAGNELSSGTATGAQLEQDFRDYFEANLESRSVSLDNIQIVRFEASESTGKISAEAHAKVPTTLLALTGTKEVDIGVPVEAVFASEDIEVAMVLDVTGSMKQNGKLQALKSAASDAIGILLPNGSTGDRVRIGVVPYSSAVNAGGYAATASAGQAGKDDCVTERGGSQSATDASYSVSPVLAQTSACPGQSILPLTSNATQLVNQIGSFTASGYTAGHIGIAWGYYMLSENWRSLWRGAEPARYSDPVHKVAIIMTDGEFNTYYYGVKGNVNRQENRSSDAAEDLCTDMKRTKGGSSGITIYAIAFDAPYKAEKLLKQCASPDTGDKTHFFSASDPEELRAAFATIASDIRQLRLSR